MYAAGLLIRCVCVCVCVCDLYVCNHGFRKVSGPHVCGDALDIEASSLSIVTGSWRYQESLQVKRDGLVQ